MNPLRYKRRSLALFFVIAFVPALTVGAIWYAYSQSSTNILYVNIQSFIIPAMLAGVMPALVLSFIFAEMLELPVRRIHSALSELVKGQYNLKLPDTAHSEFGEINGQLNQLSSRMQQTTSEAASETALIAAERNKLRGVLNTMSDGVFALDNGNRIILFNRAASELTGRTIESVAGQLAEKVMQFRLDGELVMTRWLTDLQGAGGTHRGQWKNLELYRADGNVITVNVEAAQLDQDPNGIKALVTFHDITATRQLEDMKVDFVALAAHELRTPLTEIRGYLDILLHDTPDVPKPVKELVESAFSSSQMLTGLVNNLLNVARIEHGELSFVPKLIDWSELLDDLEPLLASRARAANVKLSIVAPVKLPKILVDPVAITEVINNLVNNAITHSKKSRATIEITASRRGDEIETIITDNGSGIPDDAIAKLFTKFYRVEGLSTTHGTGLGLYISKSIVEAHGGHIWAESTLGEGSSFGFRLPIKSKVAVNHRNSNTVKVIRGHYGWIKNNTIR